MATLNPKKITIESNLKFFGLEIGASSGSTLTVDYEIEGSASTSELKSLYLTEKERLDQSVLLMEYARGALSGVDFTERKTVLTANYDKMLKRNVDADD